MQRLGRSIWLIITILLVTVTITFATSNEAVITLYLWPFDGKLSAPIWLVALSSFIIGGLFSILFMWAQALAIRVKLWNLQLKFNKLEAKMAQQQSVAETHSDNQARGLRTANYTPVPNTRGQERKTFLTESLQTDHTLR